MNLCRTCSTKLTDDNWFPSFQKTDSYECKVCSSERNKRNRSNRGEEWLEYRKQYAKKRKKENRCYNLRKKYGISLQEWADLFEEQGCSCKICGTKDEPSMGWHTDHCHSSGLVRGILCHSCNTGLGKFRDNRELLLKAADYLGDLV